MAIFQVTHKQRFHSQEVRNVFYYETQVGNPTDTEWQDIADEIRADALSEKNTRMVSAWSMYGIDYRQVDTAGLLTFSKSFTLGDLVGGSGVDSTATQIAVLVSVKGNTVKPNRARSYLAGWFENAIVNSLVGSGAQADAENFIDLQSVLNAAGTNPLQRVAAQWNLGHTAVVAWNNIAGQASKASSVPATQRRRRIGVGI